MSVTPIRLFGDPVLRTPAEPVVDFDAELAKLLDGGEPEDDSAGGDDDEDGEDGEEASAR